jgi:8-oxo-dGTP pyrophosphatase MutT (NUDIX family)
MEICDTEISCVARECKEELGMEVKPYERVCIIDDCYNDRWFRNIYYSATIEKEHLPPAMVEDEIALGLRPVWLRKDGIVDFLLAQTILPVRLAEGHLLTVLNSHYREICALLTYFGSPLIPIPETLRSSAKRMVVESSETVPS